MAGNLVFGKVYIFLAPAAGFCPSKLSLPYCCPATTLLMPYYCPITALLLPYYYSITATAITTTVTALTWRIVMTWCCYDTSTDLTPERHVYIPPHPPYIDPHTTSFVYYIQSPRTSYLDCRHVL